MQEIHISAEPVETRATIESCDDFAEQTAAAINEMPFTFSGTLKHESDSLSFTSKYKFTARVDVDKEALKKTIEHHFEALVPTSKRCKRCDSE